MKRFPQPGNLPESRRTVYVGVGLHGQVKRTVAYHVLQHAGITPRLDQACGVGVAQIVQPVRLCHQG